MGKEMKKERKKEMKKERWKNKEIKRERKQAICRNTTPVRNKNQKIEKNNKDWKHQSTVGQ